MKSKALVVFILLNVLIYASCTHSTKASSSDEQIALNYLSSQTQILGTYKSDDILKVYKAMTSLDDIEIREDSQKKDTTYYEYFKTNDLKEVKNYIKRNTKAWIFDPDFSKTLEAFDKAVGNVASPTVEGANVSFLIWLMGQLNPSFQNEIKKEMNIGYEDAQHGVIFINTQFLPHSSNIKAQDRFNNIKLLALVAHEATHSNTCGNKISLKKQSEINPDVANCFAIHTKCKNSNSEGLFCDATPWGPYTVNYIILTEVARQCIGCGLINLYLEAFDKILMVNTLPDSIRLEIYALRKMLTPTLEGKAREKVTFKIGQIYASIEHYLLANKKR